MAVGLKLMRRLFTLATVLVTVIVPAALLFHYHYFSTTKIIADVHAAACCHSCRPVLLWAPVLLSLLSVLLWGTDLAVTAGTTVGSGAWRWCHALCTVEDALSHAAAAGYAACCCRRRATSKRVCD